ncbi:MULTISPECIES: hypothetical protein [Pseudophaeobacter]|uniref:hypothetical protein n=1 Tax=Pseudophaeobacter TaxID=1541822 RepID=UPI002432BA8C|nr:hypothetical protein [Pseudophaeobacter profundi]
MATKADPVNTYLAGRLAQRHATDLVAYSGFEWPKGFIGEDNPVTERLHEAALSFAVNARRYLEHTGDRPTISETRYANDSGDETVENRLYETLHGLIHSRFLRIQYSPLTKSNYNGIEGVAPVYFIYETDRYPEKKSSIFGMAWSFLTMPKQDTNS